MAEVWSGSAESISHVNHSLLYNFVFDIVTVVVHFLISLLFPVNCFYLNHNFMCLQFYSPAHHWVRKGEGMSTQQQDLEILSGSTKLESAILKS